MTRSRGGFFIVLEGPEGSGKSSLMGPLAERMRECQVEPVIVREPGGTRAAEMAFLMAGPMIGKIASAIGCGSFLTDS